MAKRVVLGILGTIVAFGSLLPLGYAFLTLKDFGNPDIAFWPNVLDMLLMGSIALAGIWTGVRFIGFALSGESTQRNNLAEPILLGIGCFFPGFIFSLPITALWVDRVWPNDRNSDLLPFEMSGCVGVAAAVVGTVLLLRKRARALQNCDAGVTRP